MMTKSGKKIRNLEKLIIEKHQLQTFCTYQEKLITYKFDHLKKNFPEIITNEILPYTPEKNLDISQLLNFVNDFILRLFPPRFRHNRLTGILLKLVQVIIIRGIKKM